MPLLFLTLLTALLYAAPPALVSFDTPYTISLVRSGVHQGAAEIVASSYEGTVLALTTEGEIRWQNELSGYTNHDLWVADLDGDGNDETLVANADGSIYCLGQDGALIWTFQPSQAPMISVATVVQDGITYVVAGGNDLSFYYLDGKGKLVKRLDSRTYSRERAGNRNNSKATPENNTHVVNFLRPFLRGDGQVGLVLHAFNNHMQGKGSLYLFEPLADAPYAVVEPKEKGPYGHLMPVDTDGDGVDEFLMGTSSMIQVASLAVVKATGENSEIYPMDQYKSQLDVFGYRVAQSVLIEEAGQPTYLTLFGSRIILQAVGQTPGAGEVLVCRYSFNDMWFNKATNQLILASSQSGGSGIHLIDLNDGNWKTAYEQLAPEGKLAKLINVRKVLERQLSDFDRPDWERSPLPVYLLAENTKEPAVRDLVNAMQATSDSPVFLEGATPNEKENWDRSTLGNAVYAAKRDRRMKYTADAQGIIDQIVPEYSKGPGLAFWAGHGNDPYMISTPTLKRVLDGAKGKRTVLIYPELEAHDENFSFVLKNHLYPIAEHARKTNAKIFVRNKHTFWHAGVYLPQWSKLVSGEYADVFVPAMEETTDKSMELSLAGRLGLWAAGSVDDWGTRCARDNASYFRARQHSHQMVPNHFLRTMVYHASLGARYMHNFAVDQEYISVLWELIARGALYVPQKNELLSISPVHLSMLPPDDYVLQEGSNVKWSTFYDEKREADNKLVFSRLNGTWPAAPNTEYDFSRYAANVKDRKLNFLPNYPAGIVLLTPPQNGPLSPRTKQARGLLADHLHPLYRDILTEYYTDGRDYFSSDGKEKFPAETYYKKVADDIDAKAKLLPITVTGEVAWVVSQTSPTHLRLTLIDNGWVNPDDRMAQLTFNTIAPVKITDLLSGETFTTSDNELSVLIATGSFRFLDVELGKPLE
ncbi:hypothetical protein GGR26_001159 [Lewinella marina]|uniref:Lambda-carrageenase n=1 Tax=Neolewinella marina TaxID=438751 RepID=A0A2G0CG12_9BACT|nr:PQQ-binding-like beta-propeller repeat protein [Neolewinella marina]NJB85414.1 hypothetical protein [Neolewinella marina]PHK98924.1 hypothetical protein CGL56_10560 [Neolewinella marina]